MSHTVSITSQGQITIPAELRKELGFHKKTKALLQVKDGALTMKPVKDFLDFRGAFKTSKKPLSNKELDDVIATAVAEDYAKSIR